ncbi:hypothetical protein Nepgr_000387 [Nepenthes gracilis]|uniref:BZIP domain-containing protein n=1 Tax=Nepenthes gracilis TaxID=150966 RepID=A0AAD3RWS7_NEPGR|nr:hypothetical protein Nepgr_000387 [Nepenthes gracilis]
MAQPPPRVPPIVPQEHWPSHHDFPATHHQTAFTPNTLNSPWDEFMEFSAASTHRLPVGNSTAFAVERFRVPEGGGGGEGANVGGESEFERFDDEQFLSMFDSELVRAMMNSPSNYPTSSSDCNSHRQKRKLSDHLNEKPTENVEREEPESSCGADKELLVHAVVAAAAAAAATTSAPIFNDPVGDPKRVKRILANRQSAQRSRVRKVQYVSQLERTITSLQHEVSRLSPRVAYLDRQRMLLNVENSALKAKIAALAQDKIFKDAHQEALRREIERLRQLYYHQTLRKAENSISPASPPLPVAAVAQPPSCDVKVNDKGQIIS